MNVGGRSVLREGSGTVGPPLWLNELVNIENPKPFKLYNYNSFVSKTDKDVPKGI